MKFAVYLLLFAGALTLGAQQPGGDYTGPAGQNRIDAASNPLTLATPAEGNRNYLNFTANADGTYDLEQNGVNGKGYDIGWGVTGVHLLRGGALSLNYHGDYRYYANGFYNSGNDENLAISFTKVLNRRWSFAVSESAGIYLAGASYFSLQPSESNAVQFNPFSSNTKFLSTSVTAAYQFNRRLSFQLGTDYFVNRYTGSTPFGSNGVTATGSLLYRLSKRTTFSGNYSFTNYAYQQTAGNSKINTFYAGVSHDFASRWSVSASGGVSRSNSSGFVTYALTAQLANLLGTSTVIGHYDVVTYFPYFQGSVSRHWRRSLTSLTGGQSISPGNGFYLAAKNLNVNGVYSYTMRNSSFGISGFASRLGSVSVGARPFMVDGFSASFGQNFSRYLGANLRYDFVKYNTQNIQSGTTDNRFSVGFVFHTREVPVTLF